MSKTTTTLEKSDLTNLSADDLALIAAVLVVIADAVALLAVLKARTEKI